MKIFWLLLIIPLVSALDCNYDSKLCSEIQNSNLSLADQTYLLSDTELYPDFNYIRDWNLANTNFTVNKINQKYIQNAYVKILTIMPAVLYHNIIFINNSGEILTAADYQVKIPTTTINGDCKTQYQLLQNSAELTLYANDLKLSSGNLIKYYNFKDNLTFKAKYDLTVLLEIKHYQKKKDSNNQWVCSYQNTENSLEHLVLQDTLTAQVDYPNLNAEFKIKKFNPNSIQAQFNFTSNVNLNFQNAFYQEYHYLFSEILLNNVLWIKAEDYNYSQQRNLIYQSGTLWLSNLNNCSIKLSSFFQEAILPCDLSYSNQNFSIKTDKLIYSNREIIYLNLTPKNNYSINYANKNFTSNQLIAEYPYNRITLSNGIQEEYYLIHVKNNIYWNLLFTLFLFGIICYIIINLFSNYFKRSF